MIRLLVLAIVAYIGFRALRNWMLGGGPTRRDLEPLEDDLVKDPVCGVYVAARDGVRVTREGREFVFCSPACRDRFLAGEAGDEAAADPHR